MEIKNELKILPKAMICDYEDSLFRGDVTISSGCVIHPSVKIIAKSGPIIIGENCILEEYVTIVYDVDDDKEMLTLLTKNGQQNVPPLIIGPNNVFEVGCTVKALQIGEKNVFECKSYVSSKVKISNGCIIGANVQLEAEHDLPENTIIYGKQCNQREVIEKQGSQNLQLDYLRKILPNYHHLRKVNVDPKKIQY